MAHVGLQTWGSEGDVQPFLALARGLADAGHDVRLVMTTQSDKHYDPLPGVRLERVGADVSGAEGAALLDRVMALESPLKQARLVLEEALLPQASALADEAAALVAWSDVVVRHHFLYMTRDHATRAGVPEISVFLTPDLLPTRAHPPTGMPSLGPFQSLGWWAANKGIGSVFLPPAKRLRAELGLPPAKGMLHDVWPSATANLVAVSPALFPRPHDWSERTHLTGFLRGPVTSGAALAPALEAFLEAGAPPIYASFGSLAPWAEPRLSHTARLLVEAARAVGRRIIVQLPAATDLDGDEDVLRVEASPHAQVFPRCAMVVHHGGAGVTQTTVRAGTRAVVVPHMADQVFWAGQVEQLGVGVAAPMRARVTVQSLARALERALDLDADGPLETVREALEVENGVREAVAVVEGALVR